MDAVLESSHKLRVMETLKGALSQELIDRLCDSLVEDLKQICALTKAGKKPTFRESYGKDILTTSWKTEGEFKGTYVGVGLGIHWLGLTIVEEQIIAALQARFSKSQTASETFQGRHTETLLGPVGNYQEIYSTPDGTFLLNCTYTWFVKRRVD